MTSRDPAGAREERLAIIAVAPRSFWKSSPRSPTERGILIDYSHILQYTLDRFPTSRITVYGHSLGGAAAACLLSRLRELERGGEETRRGKSENIRYHDPRYRNIKGLVLENPFASIPRMVKALYPERWAPYRHLAPLAFDKWDAIAAMHKSTDEEIGSGSVLKRLTEDMMMILSEKDEVVPKEMGAELFEVAVGSRANANDRVGRKIVIQDALHENAWEQRQWLKEMKRYMTEIEALD